jgi:hypothetical protein
MRLTRHVELSTPNDTISQPNNSRKRLGDATLIARDRVYQNVSFEAEEKTQSRER